jgi:hypothetical protein
MMMMMCISETRQVSNNLQAVNMTMIGERECQRKFPSSDVTAHHVCFLNGNKADGACNVSRTVAQALETN